MTDAVASLRAPDLRAPGPGGSGPVRAAAGVAPGPSCCRISGPRTMARGGPLDPREAAWRPDLADVALAGVVAVPSYARPAMMQVAALSAPLFASPDHGAPMASELLHGEGFALLDCDGDFAWGYGLHDHYVGYVPAAALAPAGPAAGTESRIGPGDGLLFAGPSIKAPVVAVLPVGAVLRWRPHDTGFVELVAGPHAGAFLHRRHLAPAEADWVEVASQFVGAPYRWGGRTRAGVDCSGLVQAARLVAGFSCRRDSDMQAADAEPVAAAPRRGDLACWPGHIGVMVDSDRLLHANAYWMRCLVEPLADVAARAGGPPEMKRPRRA